ncbi:MAG: hypothetical protein ACI88Z_001815, partial [Sphingobacteriales bacterium]
WLVMKWLERVDFVEKLWSSFFLKKMKITNVELRITMGFALFASLPRSGKLVDGYHGRIGFNFTN